MTEAIDNKIETKYRKAAGVISGAGGTPLPITDTLISILKYVIEEDDLDFIMAFRRKKSQTLEELMKSSKLCEEEILEKTNKLASKGVMFNQPSSKGIMIYRLLPLVNVGVFEYFFMKKLEYSAENKEIADLFAKLKEELGDFVQRNYDTVVPTLLKQLPIDRTVPILKNKKSGKTIIIDKELEIPIEQILPTQRVEDLINKFDNIAVGHCFCRHHKDLLGDPCKQTNQRENCLTFGKSARHVAENGFGRLISREEALKILNEAKEDGLVHKAYHPNFDISRDESSICNCCYCCCGQSPPNLIGVTINATKFSAIIDHNLCVGCGTCIEKCHYDAIELNDENKAEVTGKFCVGCGVCAYFCPENAISLTEDERIVRIPPPRRK